MSTDTDMQKLNVHSMFAKTNICEAFIKFVTIFLTHIKVNIIRNDLTANK